MAYQSNELVSSNAGFSALRFQSFRQISATISNLSGAPVLPALTPMAYDAATGEWVPWNNANVPAGTNVIRGLLSPESTKEIEGSAGLATSATDETLAIIVVEGVVHRDDVALPSGETQGNLDTALKSVNRNPLIRVQGLAGVAPG